MICLRSTGKNGGINIPPMEHRGVSVCENMKSMQRDDLNPNMFDIFFLWLDNKIANFQRNLKEPYGWQQSVMFTRGWMWAVEWCWGVPIRDFTSFHSKSLKNGSGNHEPFLSTGSLFRYPLLLQQGSIEKGFGCKPLDSAQSSPGVISWRKRTTCPMII